MSKYEDVHFVDTKQPVWNYSLFSEADVKNFQNGTHYSLYELFGNKQEPHEFLYWEFPSYKGQQAVRLGKWKGIRKDIFDGNHEISKKIIDANNPMIIMGESLLNLGSSKYFFNSIKNFLTQNKKISEEWNSFNILSCDASTVGNYDLGIINESNNLLEDLQNHKFDIVYLIGQDNLNFDKKDEFIISYYLGGTYWLYLIRYRM